MFTALANAAPPLTGSIVANAVIARSAAPIADIFPGSTLVIAGAGAPIPDILPAIVAVFKPVVHILPAVADVFHPIPQATIVSGVPAILAAITHVFNAVVHVLMLISRPLMESVMALLRMLVEALMSLLPGSTLIIAGAGAPFPQARMVLHELLEPFRVVLLHILEPTMHHFAEALGMFLP